MDLVKYAKSILARRSEAVTLKRATASIGDWKPQAHRCHENVRAWVQRNPHHKQVFGYVLFNFGILGQRVMAHSAVEDENGILHDITPHGASGDYPFVRHVGSKDEFAQMAVAIQVDVLLED